MTKFNIFGLKFGKVPFSGPSTTQQRGNASRHNLEQAPEISTSVQPQQVEHQGPPRRTAMQASLLNQARAASPVKNTPLLSKPSYPIRVLSADLILKDTSDTPGIQMLGDSNRTPTYHCVKDALNYLKIMHSRLPEPWCSVVGPLQLELQQLPADAIFHPNFDLALTGSRCADGRNFVIDGALIELGIVGQGATGCIYSDTPAVKENCGDHPFSAELCITVQQGQVDEYLSLGLFNSTQKDVFELGMGYGIVASDLIERGFSVTSVDSLLDKNRKAVEEYYSKKGMAVPPHLKAALDSGLSMTVQDYMKKNPGKKFSVARTFMSDRSNYFLTANNVKLGYRKDSCVNE